jgi:hypothetical protein
MVDWPLTRSNFVQVLLVGGLLYISISLNEVLEHIPNGLSTNLRRNPSSS